MSAEFNEPIETPTPYDCTMIENMKKNNDTIVNPIYEWSDYDIWNYIQTREVKVNPLYAKGYKRVGCIGCPMGSYRGMVREFHDYPIYRNNYVKAFDRMIKAREEAGLKNEWKNGEEVYLWWIGEWTRMVKGQISIDEYMEENK